MIPLVLFAALGGGISYIDRVYDDAMFSKKKAVVLAPLLVIIWLFLAASHKAYATLLLAILFASLMTGKVDTPIFKGSAALLLIGLLVYWPGILWPSVVILMILGIIDEVGNDYADRKQETGIVEFFFTHRFCMKLGVLGLAVVSWLPWMAFAAIMAFDIAYDGVVIIGARIGPREGEKPTVVAGGH